MGILYVAGYVWNLSITFSVRDLNCWQPEDFPFLWVFKILPLSTIVIGTVSM